MRHTSSSDGTKLDVTHLLSLLHGIQHRGRDSWGVASVERGTIAGQVRLGKLPAPEIRIKPRVIDTAIGHVGERDPAYAAVTQTDGQPVLANSPRGPFAIAFNGRLGASPGPEGAIDAQTITLGLATHPSPNWEVALQAVAAQLQAAFCITVLTEHGVYYVRDSRGYRPLVTAILGCPAPSGATDTIVCRIVASERNSVEALQEKLRATGHGGLSVACVPVAAGTVGFLGCDGSHREWRVEAATEDLQRCTMEAVAFMATCGKFDGLELDYFRDECGRELARLDRAAGVVFDYANTLVLGYPGSGVAAGRGYAASACLLYSQVLVKPSGHKASGVTLRASRRPSTLTRRAGLRPLKALAADVEGKTVIVVDDTIVTAGPIKQAVQLLMSSGATSVHVRIASPAVVAKCRWGVVFPDIEDIFAARKAPTAKRIKAVSLVYLPMVSLKRLTGEGFCTGCLEQLDSAPKP